MGINFVALFPANAFIWDCNLVPLISSWQGNSDEYLGRKPFLPWPNTLFMTLCMSWCPSEGTWGWGLCLVWVGVVWKAARQCSASTTESDLPVPAAARGGDPCQRHWWKSTFSYGFTDWSSRSLLLKFQCCGELALCEFAEMWVWWQWEGAAPAQMVVL